MLSKINFVNSRINVFNIRKSKRLKRSVSLINFKHIFFKYENFIFVWHSVTKTAIFRLGCKKYGLSSVSIPNNFFSNIFINFSDKDMFINNFFKKGRICLLYSIRDNYTDFIEFLQSSFISFLMAEEDFYYALSLIKGNLFLENTEELIIYNYIYFVKIIIICITLVLTYICWVLQFLVMDISISINMILFTYVQ